MIKTPGAAELQVSARAKKSNGVVFHSADGSSAPPPPSNICSGAERRQRKVLLNSQPCY